MVLWHQTGLAFNFGASMKILLPVILTFFGGGIGCSVYAEPLEEIEKRLEELSLERLAHVQADPNQKLDPFVTDGCSGGMSDGWRYVAAVFPSFDAKFSSRPPWESCCVEHDRSYWRGETVDGYAKRKKADQILKMCVTDTGQAMSEDLSEELNAAPAQIESAFAIAGELMYKAVRVGGKPCTIFSWRWGYGWPLCPILGRGPDNTQTGK